MRTYILNRVPEYMDDRTTIRIVLSDDLRYRVYSQVPSNKMSSWYDEDLGRAFTTSNMDEIPEKYRGDVIQHNTSTGTASVMYPNLTATTYVADSSKTFFLPAKPTFHGSKYMVFWDVYGDHTAVSSYTADSPLSDLQHTYPDYGEHAIKFSQNVESIRFEDKFERVKAVDSRAGAFQKLDYVYFCRNLESLKLGTLSCIDTEWYDCYELTSVELPELEEISCAYSVNCMYNLQRFYAPRLKRISKATGVFKGDVSLQEINFPQLTSIFGGNGYTFMTNVSLTAANCPALESCLPSDFSYCVNLVKTDFSSLTAIPTNMFRDCLSLKELKFPRIQHIAAYAFYRCKNLRAIDLRGVGTVPALTDVNAFTGLPAGYKVIVSRELESSFKQASVWRTIADHITSEE